MRCVSSAAQTKHRVHGGAHRVSHVALNYAARRTKMKTRSFFSSPAGESQRDREKAHGHRFSTRFFAHSIDNDITHSRNLLRAESAHWYQYFLLIMQETTECENAQGKEWRQVVFKLTVDQYFDEFLLRLHSGWQKCSINTHTYKHFYCVSEEVFDFKNQPNVPNFYTLVKIGFCHRNSTWHRVGWKTGVLLSAIS